MLEAPYDTIETLRVLANPSCEAEHLGGLPASLAAYGGLSFGGVWLVFQQR